MGNPKIIEKKKKIVEEIAQKFEEAQGIYFTDFKGMNVAQVNEMRRAFDEQDVEYKVYKNSYISFAVKGTSMEENLGEKFIGNTSIALSYEDPVSPARVIKEISKKYKRPRIKSAFLEGRFFDEESIKKVADLPSRDVLLSQAVAGIQAPISSFVYTLGGILSNFVYTVEAVKNKKEENK
ncbi:MAG: 50S ribosomal protein L10 [candidate division WOR-3 bacterium]|nr:50S ribosomal protein L10 [candidate division WOR-3 bacterium]